MKKRCAWCGDDPLYVSYHDNEWGVPVHEDRKLFELLTLEGAQAGLNWLTILRKRENYQKAFSHFDIEKLARCSRRNVQRLLADPGIIRNHLKIESVIRNARGVLKIKQEFGSFNDFLWRYVDYAPKQNAWKSLRSLPTQSKESQMLSKDLKKRGFNFVGPTICYAFMQAVGMVNDHLSDCYRHKQIMKLGNCL